MSLIKNALVLGAGYVLGAHAGRPRYEQLKQQATRFLQRPEVKQAGNRVKDAVAQKLPGAAPRTTPVESRPGGRGRRTRGEKAATWGVGAAQTGTGAATMTAPTGTVADLDDGLPPVSTEATTPK